MSRARHQDLIFDREAHQARGAARSKVFRLAALLTPRGTVRAHLLDVSEAGARLHCPARLTTGEEVAIEAAGIAVRGRVMWVADDRAGLRFNRPLGADALARLVGRV